MNNEQVDVQNESRLSQNALWKIGTACVAIGGMVYGAVVGSSIVERGADSTGRLILGAIGAGAIAIGAILSYPRS